MSKDAMDHVARGKPTYSRASKKLYAMQKSEDELAERLANPRARAHDLANLEAMSNSLPKKPPGRK